MVDLESVILQLQGKITLAQLGRGGAEGAFFPFSKRRIYRDLERTGKPPQQGLALSPPVPECLPETVEIPCKSFLP
jgi:hypothetical protein